MYHARTALQLIRKFQTVPHFSANITVTRLIEKLPPHRLLKKLITAYSHPETVLFISFLSKERKYIAIKQIYEYEDMPSFTIMMIVSLNFLKVVYQSATSCIFEKSLTACAYKFLYTFLSTSFKKVIVIKQNRSE